MGEEARASAGQHEIQHGPGQDRREQCGPKPQADAVETGADLLLGSGTLGCAVSRALLGWGVRRPPIWQCDHGHMICSTCRPKVRTCHTCRGRYSSEQRLYFAERLLEKVPVACKYSEDGCEMELVPSLMLSAEMPSVITDT